MVDDGRGIQGVNASADMLIRQLINQVPEYKGYENQTMYIYIYVSQ